MPVAISRRDLFKRGSVAPASILPPWARSFDDYKNLCNGCGDCVASCPSEIIDLDDQMLAKVDYFKGTCDFCGKCETACETGAIDKNLGDNWQHKAQINAKCLSLNGVVCRLCEEACEQIAIKFRLMLEGKSIPLVNEDSCNGCGGCVSVCPVKAVDMEIPKIEEIRA